MTLLDIRGFVRRHGTQSIGPINLRIGSGTAVGLVGANGAGKTTLMRSVLGLDRPDEGAVLLGGRPVRPGRPHALAAGMVEEPVFFDWLSGSANIRAAFPHRPPRRQDINRVLTEVGLGDAGDRLVRDYSQGMRQRLGLARVLSTDAPLLVLDEPTNGLDPRGIQWLRTLVLRLVGDGRSILLSSHLLHEVQAACTEVLVLQAGRQVASGPLDELTQYRSLEDLCLSLTDDPERTESC